jgi:two-component system, chemotaxis family, sensor kinase CheA
VKIKTKLVYSFAMAIIVMIVLLGVGIYVLEQLDKNVNDIVSDRYIKVKLIRDIRFESHQMDRNVKSMLRMQSQADLTQEITQIEEARSRIEMVLLELEALSIQDRMQNDFVALKASYNRYLDKQNQIITSLTIGDRETAIRLYEENTDNLQKLMNTIGDNVAWYEKGINQAFVNSEQLYNRSVNLMFSLVVLGVILLSAIGIWVVKTIASSLSQIVSGLSGVTYGSTTLPRIELNTMDEFQEIAGAFNAMTRQMEEHAAREMERYRQNEAMDWLKTKFGEVTTLYQGVEDLETLGQIFINHVAPIVGASLGVFYIKETDQCEIRLRRLASYAYTGHCCYQDGFHIGEGLVGQCAADNRMLLLTQVPREYVKIESGVGAATPLGLIVLPVASEGEVMAVIELASFESFSDIQQQLLTRLTENLGITLQSIAGRMRVEQLLKESQALAEKLKMQTEELQQQQEELEQQQEELACTNEQLAEQYKQSEQKTSELERIQAELEKNASQLAASSRYKSQFVANMSHELRTPLNSLLILAKMLVDNADNNLTAKQVEFATTIYSAGCDLLKLINEILDLAKIENGKMEIRLCEVFLGDTQNYVKQQFTPVATQKGLDFTIEMDKDVPLAIYTDEQRLNQILNNLLSNAFKFTHRGGVRLNIRRREQEIVFSIIDTGIGIVKEKLDVIFEAFQQADGTTSRNYGGTGLGLAISSGIASLLGGWISVDSEAGQGCVFALHLPMAGYTVNKHEDKQLKNQKKSADSQPLSGEQLPQEDKTLFFGKKVLLVDDDMRNVFSLTTLLESYRMEVLYAENGKEGLEILSQNHDMDIILMDIMMPEMDGYEAMRRIREIERFKNLPIIALTAKAMKDDHEKCIAAGASDYISKPVNIEQLFSVMRVWLYVA